jgi:uncharacterized protein YegP (UPF0339 family)
MPVSFIKHFSYERRHNMAATFELFEDAKEEFRWRLRHQNGQIIADSGEGYVNKADAKNGIQSVKENAPSAPIKDLTD